MTVDVRERLPYGEGVFRRRFLLVGEPRRVRGDMEDDFHRFGVTLEHDGERILRVEGVALRHPWTECPGATAPLRALEGMALSTRPSAAAEQTNPRANCTHLFDLASLAVAHAARGATRLRYDVTVPDRDAAGRTRPTLHRDGERILEWDVLGAVIEGPASFAGVKMRGAAFVRWCAEHLDEELAEAAIVLRRGCFISMGRAQNLDDAPNATAYMPMAMGTCHSFTPGIAETAARVKGTTWDFTRAPERLLADIDDVSG